MHDEQTKDGPGLLKHDNELDKDMLDDNNTAYHNRYQLSSYLAYL